MAIRLNFYLICFLISVVTLIVASGVLFALKENRNKKGNIILGIGLTLSGLKPFK
jgi:Na+/phosphate symporter